MRFVDYAIVAGYLVLMVSLGAAFGRRQSRTEFFAASRSMGWFTVGLSVMATLFSSNSFAMYPSAAYGNSLRIALTLVAHSLIAPLVIWVFIPVYTRLNCETAYDYLERRFHVSIRCLASGLFILLRIGWMASATFAASLVMANVAGLDQRLVILSLGAVAILYTMLGGLRAVMWTDVVQFFVFSATILVALALLLRSQEGGAAGVWETYFEGRDHLLVDFTPSLTLKYGSWAILIGIFLEALSAFGTDQVAVQRYLAARSVRTSQAGFCLNLFGIWLVVPALLMLGVGLYAHFQAHPQELAPLLARHVVQHPDAEGLPPAGDLESIESWYRARPDQVAADMQRFQLQDEAMPHFVRLHFPAGLAGLFLAALMAAIMSSVDSGVHSITTVLIVDFRDRLFPHWRPDNEYSDLRVIRAMILVIGTVTVALACFVGPLGDVFDIGKKLTAAFGGPLLAVFLLALFFRSATSIGVFVGAVTAAVTTLVLMYRHTDWFSVWYWPIGFSLAMAISLGVSALSKQSVTTDALTFRRILRSCEEKTARVSSRDS